MISGGGGPHYLVSALPNMMHFVRTFSIMRAYGVKLTAIEEARNFGKIVSPTSKFFSKMTGGRMHTLHPTPWPYATKNNKRVWHISVTWHH